MLVEEAAPVATNGPDVPPVAVVSAVIAVTWLAPAVVATSVRSVSEAGAVMVVALAREKNDTTGWPATLVTAGAREDVEEVVDTRPAWAATAVTPR